MQKRNKHNVSGGFKGNTPAMKTEMEYNEDGVPVGYRRVDQERGNGVYHPTLGWRKKRVFYQHLLLNSLLRKIGLNGVMA